MQLRLSLLARLTLDSLKNRNNLGFGENWGGGKHHA